MKGGEIISTFIEALLYIVVNNHVRLFKFKSIKLFKN